MYRLIVRDVSNITSAKARPQSIEPLSAMYRSFVRDVLLTVKTYPQDGLHIDTAVGNIPFAERHEGLFRVLDDQLVSLA